jgi:hypothetical protein
MITHDDYMKKLSDEDRQKVLAMAKELIAEEKTLRQARTTPKANRPALNE